MKISEPPRPARLNTAEDVRGRVPVHAVWEITLACNLKCQHCGSRAGRPRPRELSTAQCLDVVRRLARLGTREISLIGGEAYLRSDWIDIIREIRSHDIYCVVQTGGRALTDGRLAKAIAAGLQGLGVSVDGPPALHDRIRGVPGSFDMAMSALERAHGHVEGTRHAADSVMQRGRSVDGDPEPLQPSRDRFGQPAVGKSAPAGLHDAVNVVAADLPYDVDPVRAKVGLAANE